MNVAEVAGTTRHSARLHSTDIHRAQKTPADTVSRLLCSRRVSAADNNQNAARTSLLINLCPSAVILLTSLYNQAIFLSFSAIDIYLIEERQLIFLTKLLYSNNFILRTLACRFGVRFEILGLASKYGLNTVQTSKSMVKDVIWTCFKHSVHF